MDRIYNEEWYHDKKNLRKASATVGAILILFFVFMFISAIVIVLTFNLIMNGTFPTNKSEYQDAVNYFVDYSQYMNIILDGLSQLFSLIITVSIISLFYNFKPLEIVKLKSKKKDFIEKEYDEIDNTTLKTKTYNIKSILSLFPIIIMVNNAAVRFISTFTLILREFGIVPEQVNLSFDNIKLTTLIIFFLRLCVFAPIIEEFLFRGCIIKILKPYGTWFAIIVSSIMFGLIHGYVEQGFGAFAIGIIFGFVAVKANSIIPAIILHALNNLFLYIGMIFDLSDYKDILNIAYIIMFFIILGLGVWQTIKHAKKFKLENNNTTALSTKKVYATFFLNAVVLIFIAYEVVNIVSTLK